MTESDGNNGIVRFRRDSIDAVRKRVAAVKCSSVGYLAHRGGTLPMRSCILAAGTHQN